MTIADIKRINAEKGYQFFEKGAMRFFHSRILPAVFEGPGGVYFITSEQFVPSSGVAEPRFYKIRKFDPDTGRMKTVGREHVTAGKARYWAKTYAKFGVKEDAA